MIKLTRNIKHRLIKLGVLTAVFITALASYFFISFKSAEAEYTVYTSMAEATLPVVYVRNNGRLINAMHGYLQDMGNNAAGDSVTVLPEDRELEIVIADYHNTIIEVVYEIRSLDLSHFVERTSVTGLRSEDGYTYATLPIQNLITKDTQYLLKLQVDTGEDTINYYTKIVWTDDEYIDGMVEFAVSFAEKTFDYEEARELTTYLETDDIADNSDLSTVDIRSSFSQLTWADTGMELLSEPSVTIKEYDGMMAAIELSYTTGREDETGSLEIYNVKDEYTLRQGSERIYLMHYERTADQIFDGSRYLFSGRRIDLGISAEGSVHDMKSENGRYIAFKSDRELWCYDQEDRIAVSVFSFRSGTDDGVRSNYDKHDIKILSLSDRGVLDLVVYGYMNRGVHEGYNGIAYYRYDMENDVLTELFFIPINYTYEKIKVELDELCKKGANDMLYLKQYDSVYAIDLNSLEVVVIAADLSYGGYAVDNLQTMFAWQEEDTYSSQRIRLLDIETGVTQTIESDEDEYLRVIGFSNDDVIIGYAGVSDSYIIGGRIKGLPMYRIEILDGDLELVKEYSRESIYVDDVSIEGSRILLTLYRKSDETGRYVYYGDDTIVSTEDIDMEPTSIQMTNDEIKKRVYYISLDNEIRTSRSLDVRAPEQISYEHSGTIELSRSETNSGGMIFYAYASGELLLCTPELCDAVDACYDEMGYVTDQNGVIVYNRTDRENVVNIQDPTQVAYQLMAALENFTESRIDADNGIVILDTYGLSLNQLLYYVYKGIPVVVYTEGDSYVFISGYDNKDVRIYDPQISEEAGRVTRISKEDAEVWLREIGNNTISAKTY